MTLRKYGWALAAGTIVLLGFQQATKAPVAAPADPLIDGFRKSTVASVADAVDQVVGKRGFLSHEFRPRVAGAFVGRATTAVLRATTPDKATPALSTRYSVEMIDNAQPGDVGVIQIEGSLDVAAMGGLMGTAAKARGMAGMLLDGAVRDIAELRALNLPVVSRSVSPASSVSRWASVARNVEVDCGGVKIRPGDIIVAGEDGVVIVPKDQAAAVLKRSQEIDDRESKMVPFIKQFRSLGKAIEKFNRI
ncbi:MAG: RraA family protein [Bryobacteraceae bacterium]|nr:RraA family protein [Bryobacteraceae bacterium]